MADSVNGTLTSSGKQPGRNGLRPNLVSKVSQELRHMILNGELQVGDRLPSEAVMTQTYSVSRTVIREALAALRADGLVEARQGAGVFVTESPASAAPGNFLLPNPEKISSILEILELRTAVEVEAAGLAAIRRSPAQEEDIFQCHNRFEQCILNDQPTTEADLNLHLAIANATNNPRFREFIELMGKNAIPRTTLQEGEPVKRSSSEYLRQIQAEHGAIANAISHRDEEAARDAMRTHLKGSQQRYRMLLRG